MIRIAIIGCGNLGSRHAEALARLHGPAGIDLVDPSSFARMNASALLTSSGGNLEIGQHDSADGLPMAPDVAIVATNARERASAVEQLVAIGCSRLILEKFLFTRREDYIRIGRLLEAEQVSAWVNCVRRTPPRFHRLMELIAGRPITYSVDGDGWGLASNVIHHLDEWMHLCGADNIPAITQHLQPGNIPAKRPGYLEVLGEISATSGSSRFIATCRPPIAEGSAGDRVVTIACGDTTLQVGQKEQKLRIFLRGDLLAEEPYPLPFQSEATAWHLATILAGGQPPLPHYSQAAALHLALFDALLPHLQIHDPRLNECPIT